MIYALVAVGTAVGIILEERSVHLYNEINEFTWSRPQYGAVA